MQPVAYQQVVKPMGEEIHQHQCTGTAQQFGRWVNSFCKAVNSYFSAITLQLVHSGTWICTLTGYGRLVKHFTFSASRTEMYSFLRMSAVRRHSFSPSRSGRRRLLQKSQSQTLAWEDEIPIFFDFSTSHLECCLRIRLVSVRHLYKYVTRQIGSVLQVYPWVSYRCMSFI